MILLDEHFIFVPQCFVQEHRLEAFQAHCRESPLSSVSCWWGQCPEHAQGQCWAQWMGRGTPVAQPAALTQCCVLNLKAITIISLAK